MKKNKKEDFKAKKKTQFINYLTILNHENRLLIFGPFCPKPFEDVHDGKERGGIYLNLFNSHPPFQIDGNFGATSGITELLLQSNLLDDIGDYIQYILPALPSTFSSWKISGLRGRRAFEISIVWQEGLLVEIEAKSLRGKN